MRAQTLVKICGIRDVATAIAAARAGADFIGLVFCLDSVRDIDNKTAKEIVASTKEYKTKIVGVFVNQNAGEITNVCNYTGINIAQLHGDNARIATDTLPDTIARIFAIKVNYNGTINNQSILPSSLNWQRDYLLFDGLNSGSGQPFTWDKFKPNTNFRFFLSGGLAPDNVFKAILTVTPFAVDVSSGVEQEKGVKNIELIEFFINKVKGIR